VSGDWGEFPTWNEGDLFRNPFGVLIEEEKEAADCFLYIVRKDDRHYPIPLFMADTIHGL